MPIFACGLNHKTAPITLREKIIFSSDKLTLYLQDLQLNENISEVVLLSTCNRSELYCYVDRADQIFEWVLRQFKMTRAELNSAWYCYENQEAVEHIMQVACGLDSMVVGEPQILGQMKEAFSESCAAGVIGPQFNRLFQQVFSIAKEVRTNTAIGACPVSMASAAINLAKKVFAKDLSQAKILLIGAGDTIQLALRYLKNQKLQRLMIANRHAENAAPLIEQYNAEKISFNDLTRALMQADIVITATGSTLPVVTKAMLLAQPHPVCIIDLAVPRDVEATASELQNVKLFTIDDLKNLIQQNMHGREHAAEKAKEVIKNRSQEFVAWLHSLDAVATTISSYRKQIEDLCQAELAKAMRQLAKGDDPVQVLAGFAHALTNKLLHNPSVQLRQAGAEGRLDVLQLAQQLFSLPGSI